MASAHSLPHTFPAYIIARMSFLNAIIQSRLIITRWYILVRSIFKYLLFDTLEHHHKADSIALLRAMFLICLCTHWFVFTSFLKIWPRVSRDTLRFTCFKQLFPLLLKRKQINMLVLLTEQSLKIIDFSWIILNIYD